MPFSSPLELIFSCLVYYALSVFSEKNGWTALQIASWNGYATTVQTLLDKGAQVDLKNKVRYSRELKIRDYSV